MPRTGQELGHAQRQRVGRPRRPLLHVGHLHAGGRIHPVGGLDEARQEDRVQRRRRIVTGDDVTGGIYPCGIERLEEARFLAEGVVHVARRAGEPIEMGDGCGERRHVDGGSVGLYVALGEDVGVARRVDGGDLDALRLEGLGDTGRAGEEIERGAGAGGRADLGQHRNESSLRPQVLDHATHPTMARCPNRGVPVPDLRVGRRASPQARSGQSAPWCMYIVWTPTRPGPCSSAR